MFGCSNYTEHLLHPKALLTTLAVSSAMAMRLLSISAALATSHSVAATVLQGWPADQVNLSQV